MGRMLTTRALPPVRYSLIQVVVLEFNLSRPLCIIKEEQRYYILEDNWEYIQPLSNTPFISLCPPRYDPVYGVAKGDGRCQEFQELWPSCSLEYAPPWHTDLHIEHDDPSRLMMPTVWASIISSLYPKPGWKSHAVKFQSLFDIYTVLRALNFSASLQMNSVDWSVLS